MARVYATPDEYADWLGVDDPPTGSETALRRASMVVDQMLLGAVYDVDDDRLPTNADVVEALRDATCAQAEYARATGDASLVGAAGITQVSIGSLSYTKAATGTAATTTGGNGRWSPTAWEILQQAGLTGHVPWEW